MSKFDQIEAFTKVIQHGSFAKAAQALKISPQAVSKQIALLEKRLKLQLLQRTTRSLKLTDAGKAFYQYCQRISVNMQEAEMAMSCMQDEPIGTLRIACTISFGERYVTPHLAAFSKQYPKLNLEIELSERFPNLNNEAIDILIGFPAYDLQNLVQKKIMSSRYILCAAPSYLKKHGTPKTPEELIHHAYITHSLRKNSHVIKFKNDHEIYLSPKITLNNAQAMLTCAINGMGIINLPHFVVRDAIEDGRLKEILAADKQAEMHIYLYYQMNQYLQPKIRHFIDFIVGRIASLS